jgi:hypothetical protein
VQFLAGAMMGFFFRHRVQTDSGIHPASYLRGTWGSNPRIKQPEREGDYSPPSSAEV